MIIKIDLNIILWLLAALLWTYGLALVGFDFVYFSFGLVIAVALLIETTGRD